MALTQKLEFRQSQALVMTPQLMQAIKLLQLSNLDLAAYVEGELERNPLLERAGETEPEPGEANPQAAIPWEQAKKQLDDLAARGIGKTQAADLRRRLSTFAEDWSRPEMDIYDEDPAR